MTDIVEAIRKVTASTKLPEGYYVRLEGTFQAQEEASRTIGILSLLSLLLVFAILYSRYRSTVLAFIIMGNVPLALIGSVAALWLAGQPLSVASMIGFITLTGIAVRNGILKISHYINLALKEGMPFGQQLVVRGSVERLTPVLMTAMSAGVALVPLLIDAATPGKEILHPVAVTIFGGLLSATLLDTLLTPVLFLRYGKPLWSGCGEVQAGMRKRPRQIQQPKLFDINTRRMTVNAKFLMVVAVLAWSTGASAHDEKGPNGGRVADAGSYHVELVSKSDKLELFVSDENQKPIPAPGFKAIAILVVEGKSQRVLLAPAGSARLSGTASVALPAQPKGVVQLTGPDGKTAQAKFN